MPIGRWSSIVILSLGGGVALASSPTPWEQYLSQPTSQNAKAVTQIAYSQGSVEPDQSESDLDLLAVQVVSSDLEAVRLAFRLRSRADGHLGEIIDIMLGRLIRINPRLFLTTLHEQSGAEVRLDSLLGNFGGAYVDRDMAHQYEAERRRAALLTVTDRGLVSIRDKCVSVLKGDTP